MEEKRRNELGVKLLISSARRYFDKTREQIKLNNPRGTGFYAKRTIDAALELEKFPEPLDHSLNRDYHEVINTLSGREEMFVKMRLQLALEGVL